MSRRSALASQFLRRGLDPPATELERAWARQERRRAVRKSLLKALGLFGVLGAGVALSYVLGTHHAGWLRGLPVGFVAVFIPVMTAIELRLTASETRSISLKRIADAADAQKKQFLAALDE